MPAMHKRSLLGMWKSLEDEIIKTFERYPFVYKNDYGLYEGYEISLMKDLAESMDLSWELVPPTDGGLWGEIRSDGSATGLVGDIKYGKSDVGSAHLFITEERTRHIDYTKPYTFDSVCFFLQKPPLNPKWMDMIFLFDQATWLATMVTFGCVIIFMMVIYTIWEPSQVFNIPIYMIAVMFDESIPFIQRIK